MILRKPYAFLIKKFRLIHVVLFSLILYIFLTTKALVNVFARLVSDGKTGIYVEPNISIYVAIIFVIIFGFAMYLLMTNKKKPNKFYLFLLIYYFIYIVALLLGNNYVKSIKGNDLINIQAARALYDVARIIYWPQIILILFSLIRAVGFDIKRFNFGKDVNELDLSEKDREEFEFTIGFDYQEFLIKFRNYLRELKYYFLENTTIIISLLVIGVLSLVAFTYINNEIINKTYLETQSFSSRNFQFSIANSYLTNINQNGEIISEGKYYLVVDLNITNISYEEQKLDLANFTIKTRDINILPVTSENNNFIDLGVPYRNEYIDSNVTVNNILIFEVSNYTEDDKYILKILDSVKYNEKTKQEDGVYISVQLSPQKMDQLVTKKNTYYGTTIKFNESVLKNSTLLINDYEILDNFPYKYNLCYAKDDCKDLIGVISADMASKNSTLLILDYDLLIDSKSIYSKNVKDNLKFFDDFTTVKYSVDGISRVAKVKVVNPTNYKEAVVLQVVSAIKRANKIDIYVTIRDVRYIISLK